MGIRHCPRCGGQMHSGASRCPWCGRSADLSTLIQVVVILLMLAGAGFVSGLLPVEPLARLFHLPTSNQDIEFGPGPMETGSSGGGSAGGAGPTTSAPGGSAGSTRGAEPAPTAQPARRAETDCRAPSRIALLASQYQGWSQGDLELISCKEIRRGFTTAQVAAALGSPVSVERNGARETWHYPARDVQFLDGLAR